MDDEKKKQERDNAIDTFANFAQLLFIIFFIVLLPVESSTYTKYLIEIARTGAVASAFFRLGRSMLEEEVTTFQIVSTIAISAVAILL